MQVFDAKKLFIIVMNLILRGSLGSILCWNFI